MKMRLTLTILLCATVTSFAQDSLLTLNDIAFSSEFEKRAFHDFFVEKKADHFRLFLASGTILNEQRIDAASERFSEHVQSLNNEKLNAKKSDKRIKAIFEDIHSTFLTKYEMENRFEDIFVNGYYNCVSATALYGLVFDRLNIPYVIKQKPTHVYLIAYPERDRILVETTTPTSNLITVSPSFKQAYVKMLKDQKMITADEFARGNVNETFDRFYFGEDEDITLTQLIGIQYLNEGLYFLSEKKEEQALHKIEKAYLFNSSDKIAYMMLVALHETFKAHEKKDTVHAQLLGRLSRFKKFGITSDMIKADFAQVVDELLNEKGEKEKLALYHQALISSIYDKELREDLDFYYNYENGRLLYNQGRFKESLSFFEQCLKIKPGHQETNRIFISAIAETVRNKQNNDMIKSMEDYAVRYPMLLENNFFNELLGTGYLREIKINFQMGNTSLAEKMRSLFEDFQRKHNEVTFNSYFLGEAYSAAAVYYFRKGQNSKAKAVLNKGLEISPDNYELVTRKRMIE